MESAYMKKHGLFKGNRYEILDDYAVGYTRKGEAYYLDIEDVEKAKEFTFRLDGEGYAASGIRVEGKYQHVKLHRLVMNLEYKDGKIIDHINRDKSNNRKSNLRLSNIQDNSFNQGASRNNKSGVVGVFYRERKGRKPKWIASINIDKKTRPIGYFDTIEEAIKARKEAEEKYYNGLRHEEG